MGSTRRRRERTLTGGSRFERPPSGWRDRGACTAPGQRCCLAQTLAPRGTCWAASASARLLSLPPPMLRSDSLTGWRRPRCALLREARGTPSIFYFGLGLETGHRVHACVFVSCPVVFVSQDSLLGFCIRR